VSLVRATAAESSVLVVVESSAVERAVSTKGLVVLVQKVRVEHLARGEALLAGLDGGSAVEAVLLDGVVGADLGVEGARDEFAAHVVAGGGDGLGTTVLSGLQGGLLRTRSSGAVRSRGCRALGWRDNDCGRGRGGNSGRDDRGARNDGDRARRGSDIGLVVGVGTSDNSLELLTVITLVGGNLRGEVRAPQSALVVGD